MKVFLTGGSGFLGRQLIRDMISRGYQVVGLARSVNAANAIKDLGATPVMGELGNLLHMAEAMKGCDAIIHAAAMVKMWGDEHEFTQINVEGTKNVIDAAKMAGVPRLVHISTEAVLAEGKPIINADETMPLPYFPIGLYAETKGLAEKRVLKANNKNFTAIAVRPRFIWGMGDTTLLPGIIATMKSGKWAWVNNGQNKISTCHVRNASRGILQALDHGAGGQVYFLTDGAPVVFRDFISRLVRTQGVEPPSKSSPLWLVKMAAGFYELVWKIFKLSGSPPVSKLIVNLMFMEVTVKDQKARTELGYTNVVTIEDGIAEMAETGKKMTMPETAGIAIVV